MNYPVIIPGMEGQTVEVSYSFWTGNRLFVNGEKAPKGQKRGQYTLKKNDGSLATASFRIQVLGFDVPQLQVDDTVIQVVEPLAWYQVVWSILPLALIFLGGFLGAICGLCAFYANGRIFRSKMNAVLKYFITAAITTIVIIVYLGVAIFIRSLAQQ